jgi:two-component system cell cycle sensor histidine kinase/response regulator CckA
MNILIVDDNPANLKLLQAQLEEEGYHILRAADGVEALAVLRREPVDAIISDILMPRMDGYRLCYEVRKDARFCSLPFIFYTSTYTSPSDEKLARELTADAFLRKPVSPSVILEALRAQPSPDRPAGRRVIPAADELGLMKEYSERMVSKLEGKNIELQETNLKLRESEERYRDLFDNAHDLIQTISADGRLLYVNRAWRETLGYIDSDIGNLKLLELIPADRHPDWEKLFREVLAGKPARLAEMEFNTKDGKRVAVEGSMNVKVTDGRPVSLRCIFRDVTEKKKFEGQLLRNQRLESIGTLAGGIAHDLNNALAPIMMSLQLLRMKFTDAESGALLDMIAGSAQRGADMVKQVLTFSRGLEGRRAEVQVKHLVKEMQKIIQQTFPKSIQLRTEIGKDLWTLTADATQLHQVLLNLCVNARDAMPHGGKLSIQAENLRLDEQFARMNPEARAGPHVVLSVTDTGTGIPPGIRERIFDPFFTTKALGQGTGLGLSTVRGIVKSHGGFVSVYSEPGKGTAFKVYLPSNTAALEDRVEAELPSPNRGKGELILVVEDEASVRNIAQQTLEMAGYRVLTAMDGAEGVGVCAKHLGEIQLMLVDMMMPIMDGLATIRAVRTLDPRIKIVSATGLPTEISGTDTEEFRSNAVLHKPYTAERMLKVIREALDSRARETAPEALT